LESVRDDRGCQGRVPRILILYPQRKVPRSATLLSIAMSKLGAITTLKSFDELRCSHIENFDLVVLRGLPYHYDSVRMNALITCLKNAKRVINDPKGMVLARDKYSSIKELEARGLPVPKTYLARTRGEVLNAVEVLGEAVLKPISSSLGFGVIRVDPETLFYAMSSIPFSFEIVVQEYLEKVRDVRVLVLGDKAVGAMYRISPFNVASNYAKGADVDPAPLDAYAPLAVKATRTLGLDYAGVDIIETPEGPKVIEVNPSPLWFGLSEALGKDIGIEIAKFLIRKACEDKTGADR